MIVDPDFFDHWRTGMVADILQDPCAPIYIMRLWAHCQDRKSDTFIMPTRGLKAQCRFPGDAQLFEAALIEAGFIARIDNSIHVNGWAEKNAKLLASSENGKAGGRPRKNQTETKEEPNKNPTETKQEPTDNLNIENQNLSESDKSRVDKIRNTSPIGDSDDKPSLPHCPHAKLIEIFAEQLPMLPTPKAELWGGTRARDMRNRWKWVLTAKTHSGKRYAETEADAIGFFTRFFGYISQSDFLTGRNGKWTGCTLAWLMEEANFAKAIEGNFENVIKEAA